MGTRFLGQDEKERIGDWSGRSNGSDLGRRSVDAIHLYGPQLGQQADEAGGVLASYGAARDRFPRQPNATLDFLWLQPRRSRKMIETSWQPLGLPAKSQLGKQPFEVRLERHPPISGMPIQVAQGIGVLDQTVSGWLPRWQGVTETL